MWRLFIIGKCQSPRSIINNILRKIYLKVIFDDFPQIFVYLVGLFLDILRRNGKFIGNFFGKSRKQSIFGRSNRLFVGFFIFRQIMLKIPLNICKRTASGQKLVQGDIKVVDDIVRHAENAVKLKCPLVYQFQNTYI